MRALSLLLALASVAVALANPEVDVDNVSLARTSDGQPVTVDAEPELEAAEAEGNDGPKGNLRRTQSKMCCFYQHINLGGWRFCTNRDLNFVGDQYNDAISSSWLPRGCTATVYEHMNWRGAAARVSVGADGRGNFGSTWNDRVSSVLCRCT